MLGAAVWPGGVPSPTLRRRTAAAAALWRPGDTVIPSGGLGAHPPAEAEVMRRLLIEAGIPPDAIRPETAAATTWETARHVAAMVPADARIIAVSDGYHLPRVRLAFRAFGRRVAVQSARAALPRPRAAVSARATAREALGLAAYAARIVMGRR